MPGGKLRKDAEKWDFVFVLWKTYLRGPSDLKDERIEKRNAPLRTLHAAEDQISPLAKGEADNSSRQSFHSLLPGQIGHEQEVFTHSSVLDSQVFGIHLPSRQRSITSVRPQRRRTPNAHCKVRNRAYQANGPRGHTHRLRRTYKSPMRPTNSATSTAAHRDLGNRILDFGARR